MPACLSSPYGRYLVPKVLLHLNGAADRAGVYDPQALKGVVRMADANEPLNLGAVV